MKGYILENIFKELFENFEAEVVPELWPKINECL